MNITNKSVLVTGANRGIGRALLDEALRRGAKKVYAGTRSPLQHSDKRVTPLTLDVTSASQIQRAVDEVDTLDVLINNAGIAIYDDLSNLDVIERHLAVNFLGLLKRGHRQQPVPGGARPFAGHTRLLHFEGGRVQHDAVAESPVGRPRRNGPCRCPGPHRHGYEPRLRDTEGLDRVCGAGRL
jgi:NAD(P)-dependent dehydrogenase (short-subunit alcohol dehydrogenase family)